MKKELSEHSNLMRTALIPSLAVGLIGIVVATVIRGKAGLFGALLAQCVVAIFFAVQVGVSSLSRKLDPLTSMALALFSYFAKIALLGVLLWALTNFTSRATIDRGSFGTLAILLAITWLGGEIRGFLKLRLHLPLPERVSQESQVKD